MASVGVARCAVGTEADDGETVYCDEDRLYSGLALFNPQEASIFRKQSKDF